MRALKVRGEAEEEVKVAVGARDVITLRLGEV